MDLTKTEIKNFTKKELNNLLTKLDNEIKKYNKAVYSDACYRLILKKNSVKTELAKRAEF